MSRPIRALLALFVVSFTLVVSGCADATGPQSTVSLCDVSNPNTCR